MLVVFGSERNVRRTSLVEAVSGSHRAEYAASQDLCYLINDVVCDKHIIEDIQELLFSAEAIGKRRIVNIALGLDGCHDALQCACAVVYPRAM